MCRLLCILTLTLEVSYRFSYVEEVVGKDKNSWAIRQTGVYHRYVPNGSGNVWILLHPRPESVIHTRLVQCALDWDKRRGLLEEWELTHILVFSSYFDDWRWYLKSLIAEVERVVSLTQYGLGIVGQLGNLGVGICCPVVRFFNNRKPCKRYRRSPRNAWTVEQNPANISTLAFNTWNSLFSRKTIRELAYEEAIFRTLFNQNFG